MSRFLNNLFWIETVSMLYIKLKCKVQSVPNESLSIVRSRDLPAQEFQNRYLYIITLRVHVPKYIYFGLKVVPIWVLWGQSISIWVHGPFGLWPVLKHTSQPLTL